MLKVFEFLPAALNASNDTSASGITDTRTGYEVNAGGLVIGDMFDIDTTAAGMLSAPLGALYQGRYRRVRVDVNATAANVGRGLACYVVSGPSVQNVVILQGGVAQTAGTYQVAATGGGGTGAIIQVIVSAAGTVTGNPTVVAPGINYTSVPTFILVAGGTTTATFAAQMTIPTFTVTTVDKALNVYAPRGVFLNTVLPGNYTFIQEDGIATILQAATVTSATLGAVVTPVAGGNGTSQSTVGTAPSTNAALGVALDIPVAGAFFRALLNLPVWNG